MSITLRYLDPHPLHSLRHGLSEVLHGGCEVLLRLSEVLHGGSEVLLRLFEMLHSGSEVLLRLFEVLHSGSEVLHRLSEGLHNGSEVLLRLSWIFQRVPALHPGKPAGVSPESFPLPRFINFNLPGLLGLREGLAIVITDAANI